MDLQLQTGADGPYNGEYPSKGEPVLFELQEMVGFSHNMAIAVWFACSDCDGNCRVNRL